MKQKELAKWLKWAIVGMGVCGLIVYLWVIPMIGQSIAEQVPECSYCYYPWLVFLWVTGVPCYIALALAWKIASYIGRDRSFSLENAGLLRWIARLAAGDAVLFFLGNVLYLFLNMNHPGVVLLSLLVVFAGAAISVAAAALSHLVRKAAELQEQSDWTI